MAGASALAIVGSNYCVLPPVWGLTIDYDSFVSVDEDGNLGLFMNLIIIGNDMVLEVLKMK